MTLELRDTPEGVSLRVRVQPRSPRTAIDGERGGALLLRVTAQPVDGAANEAVVRLLRRTLCVPASAVRIASGEKSRDKRVVIEGVTAAELRVLTERPATGERRSRSR